MYTEKAWQAYPNQQIAYITEMGSLEERNMTDRGLWNIFLANISLPDVHSAAFQAYMREEEQYSKLPIQGRVTKLTPAVLTYLKSKAGAGKNHRSKIGTSGW